MAALTLLAASLLFHIADPRIVEASGLATSIVHPGVAYVQNDSGDSARFFALDVDNGSTLATNTVPNATNVDWEDIAVARDRRGVLPRRDASRGASVHRRLPVARRRCAAGAHAVALAGAAPGGVSGARPAGP